MQADQDRPIDLSDFTREVAHVTGEEAAAFSRRADSQQADLLLVRAETKKVEEETRLLAERIKELPEGVHDIASQYAEQIDLFSNSGLLEQDPKTGAFGCKTISGEFAKCPGLAEIIDRLTGDEEFREDYFNKIEQGFTRFLLVPFGMRLDRLADMYTYVLRQRVEKEGYVVTEGSKHITIPTSHLNPSARTDDEPVERAEEYLYQIWWDLDVCTKDEFLKMRPRMGWRLYLVEDPSQCGLIDLPAGSDQAHPRVQIGRDGIYSIQDVGSTPRQLEDGLEVGSRDGPFVEEGGIDPETYCVLAASELLRTGQVLDSVSRSILLGIYGVRGGGEDFERRYIAARFVSSPGGIVFSEVAEDVPIEAGLRTAVEVV